ncbi:MAG: MBL fold metallo-hydrolase [Desulfurococcales archaeon]|nr:MBL fold metallo-hydrolase [Desulfurococcales archaeon]
MSCTNIMVAGTGNALHPYRSQVGVFIEHGGDMFLVDVGCFVPNILARKGVEPYEVDHVIVTHGHTDHYCGLQQLVFLKTFAQKNPKINLYTVPGAMGLLKALVNSVHYSQILETTYHEVVPGSRLSIGSMRINVFEAKHSVEAISVSVHAGDAKIVISGDTAPNEVFREESKGANLAIHEASLTSDQEGSREAQWHTTVASAIRQVSGSDLGVLYHLSPDSEKEARELQNTQGKIIVPDDGVSFKLC